MFRSISCTCVLLAASTLAAVEITPTGPIAPYRLVHVKYKAEPSGVVFVLGVQNGLLVAPDIVDVKPGHVVFTGPPGQYSVHGIEGGQRFSEIVTIGGGTPTPPTPPPVPDLTGLALEVYQQAKPVNDPASAVRMADNFATVVREIDARAIVTVEQANNRIRELNRFSAIPQTWKDFGVWCGAKLTAVAQTLPKAREAMVDIEKGLRAVR